EQCYCYESGSGGCCPNNDDIDDNATDDDGHGTSIAGIVGGKGNDNNHGVARNSSLFAVKVLNSEGNGNVSDIIQGIEWSVNNSAQIITLSLGSNGNCYEGRLADAVDNATKNGVLIVAAAGNCGPGGDEGECDSFGNETIATPACAKRSLAVGSVNDTAVPNPDLVSSFSSRGPTSDNRIKPDLTAPGANIYSTYLDDNHVLYAGTSEAVPHVAGTAALLYERYEEIHGQYPDPDLAKTILLTSVNTTGMNTDGFEQRNSWYGSGRIDTKKAIENINRTLNGSITNGETHQYNINVTSNRSVLTLYWPEDMYTDNDLNLILTDSSNISYDTGKNDSVEQIFLYNTAPGIKNFYVDGSDVDGSQEYYLASSHQISNDLIPPSLVLDKPEDKFYTRKDNLPLNFTTDSSNQTIWYTLNGTDETVLTGNKTFNVTNDGFYSFILNVNDSYGNVNSASVNFSVDSTPPSVYIQSPFQTKNNNSIWFNVSSSEPVNTSLYSLDNDQNSTLTPLNDTYFYFKETVPEGEHNVTFYVNDSASLHGTNSSQFNVSIHPVIDGVSADGPLVYVNETLNISANITEENFDSVWLNMTQPIQVTKDFINSTQNQYPNSSKWYSEFNQTSSVGTYNFTIFVNDTLSNSVNYSGSFEVSEKVRVELNNSFGENLTWKIYYLGSNNIRESVRNSSINLTIPGGIWDFNIEDNVSVTLFGMNISSDMEEEIGWRENNSLENITNNSFIFHKVSSFFFNMSFERGSIEIPFNTSVIDNKTDILRCGDWNFSLSDCDSGWKSVIQNSTVGSNSVGINTTNLSAFSIVEYCDPGCSWSDCIDGTQTGDCIYRNCTTYQSSRSCGEEDDSPSSGSSSGSISFPSPECISDVNCSSYQTCSEGSCVNVTCECGYIKNHSCVHYECCSDDDCYENKTCENHTCIEEEGNMTFREDLRDRVDQAEKKILEANIDEYNTTELVLKIEDAKSKLESGDYVGVENILDSLDMKFESNESTDVKKESKRESFDKFDNFLPGAVFLVVLIVGLVVIFKYA
ncbi:MAG: S8 family serine peptidase, partial [Candidatus Aenigmatarchaeota archaeon]